MLRDVMDAWDADGAKADAAPRVRGKIASFMIRYSSLIFLWEGIKLKTHNIFDRWMGRVRNRIWWMWSVASSYGNHHHALATWIIFTPRIGPGQTKAPTRGLSWGGSHEVVYVWLENAQNDVCGDGDFILFSSSSLFCSDVDNRHTADRHVIKGTKRVMTLIEWWC